MRTAKTLVAIFLSLGLAMPAHLQAAEPREILSRSNPIFSQQALTASNIGAQFRQRSYLNILQRIQFILSVSGAVRKPRELVPSLTKSKHTFDTPAVSWPSNAGEVIFQMRDGHGYRDISPGALHTFLTSLQKRTADPITIEGQSIRAALQGGFTFRNASAYLTISRERPNELVIRYQEDPLHPDALNFGTYETTLESFAAADGALALNDDGYLLPANANLFRSDLAGPLNGMIDRSLAKAMKLSKSQFVGRIHKYRGASVTQLKLLVRLNTAVAETIVEADTAFIVIDPSLLEPGKENLLEMVVLKELINLSNPAPKHAFEGEKLNLLLWLHAFANRTDWGVRTAAMLIQMVEDTVGMGAGLEPIRRFVTLIASAMDDDRVPLHGTEETKWIHHNEKLVQTLIGWLLEEVDSMAFRASLSNFWTRSGKPRELIPAVVPAASLPRSAAGWNNTDNWKHTMLSPDGRFLVVAAEKPPTDFSSNDTAATLVVYARDPKTEVLSNPTVVYRYSKPSNWFFAPREEGGVFYDSLYFTKQGELVFVAARHHSQWVARQDNSELSREQLSLHYDFFRYNPIEQMRIPTQSIEAYDDTGYSEQYGYGRRPFSNWRVRFGPSRRKILMAKRLYADDGMTHHDFLVECRFDSETAVIVGDKHPIVAPNGMIFKGSGDGELVVNLGQSSTMTYDYGPNSKIVVQDNDQKVQINRYDRKKFPWAWFLLDFPRRAPRGYKSVATVVRYVIPSIFLAIFGIVHGMTGMQSSAPSRSPLPAAA